MTSFEKPTEHYFVAAASGDDDPFNTLDDLMAVIEVLCPTWPARDSFESAGEFRL